MNQLSSLRTKTKGYLLDHPHLKTTWDYLFATIVTLISAFAFAYGFRAFTAPADVDHFVSGGASGTTQVLIRIVERIRGETFNSADFQTWDSIIYFVINIPPLILSWFKIGRRFTIMTFLNVLFVSIFIRVLPESMVEVFNINADLIARAVFSGILTGLSTALAVMIDSATGLTDIISFYIAEKKSTSMGKYTLIINAIIVTSYVLLSAGLPEFNSTVTLMLYTLIYFFASSKVVDILNQKYRKTQLQIITTDPNMAQVLIHTLPHGCTLVDAKGAYSGQEKKIIYIVVSHKEVNRAIKIMREIDPGCFVTVVNTYQVYGKFYIKPIK